MIWGTIILVSELEENVLMSLGLTSCQAKLYLTLCRFGKLNVSKLSEFSGIPRPDIYKIAEDLMKLGLVEKNLSRPTTYNALPIKSGIDLLFKQRTKDTKELMTRSKKVVQNFRCVEFENEVKEPDFILLPGIEQLDRRIVQLLKETKGSLDCVCSWKRLQRAKQFSDFLKNVWSRDVRCRFLIDKPEEKSNYGDVMDFIKKSEKCKVRYLPKVPSTVMTIYDSKKTIFILDPKMGPNQGAAMLLQNQSLVNALQDYFEILWITGMESPQYNLDVTHEQF